MGLTKDPDQGDPKMYPEPTFLWQFYTKSKHLITLIIKDKRII